jgi:hypothetical protein
LKTVERKKRWGSRDEDDREAADAIEGGATVLLGPMLRVKTGERRKRGWCYVLLTNQLDPAADGVHRFKLPERREG